MEITPQTQDAAFEKLSTKLKRLTAHMRAQDDATVQVKLTVGDLKSLEAFFKKFG